MIKTADIWNLYDLNAHQYTIYLKCLYLHVNSLLWRQREASQNYSLHPCAKRLSKTIIIFARTTCVSAEKF